MSALLLVYEIISGEGLLFGNISKETFHNRLDGGGGAIRVSKGLVLINGNALSVLSPIVGVS